LKRTLPPDDEKMVEWTQKCVQFITPLSMLIRLLRLRLLGAQILVENFEFAHGRAVETSLWKLGCYKLIEEYRKQLRQVRLDSGKPDLSLFLVL
jgi:hypothetical protein